MIYKTDLEILQEGFRNYKNAMSKVISEHTLDTHVQAFAYEFIKDSLEGKSKYTVGDIVAACEAALKEGEQCPN